MKTIEELCKSHRTRTYFVDGEGLTGVYNHANKVFWYRKTPAGYSLVGETADPQGAQERKLEQVTSV